MSTPHPNDLFEALLTAAKHQVKKQNLTHVHRICEHRHKSGSSVFTIAAIGRLLSAEDIMSAKTLLNPSSKDYRILIEAWAAFARPKRSHRTDINNSNDWLLLIPDPAIRTLVQASLAENGALRGEITVLRQHQEPVVILRGNAVERRDDVGAVILPATAILTAGEREALEQALSPNHLAGHDLRIGTRGEISTASGRVIFDPGFTTGLRKLMKS